MLARSITDKELYICLILFTLPPTWWYFELPGKHLFGSILFTLVFIHYVSDRRFNQIAFSYPLIIWIILTVYHIINAFYNRVPEVDALDVVHGFKIYACMALVAYWASIDYKKTIGILLMSFFVRCAVGLILLIVFGDIGSGRMTGMGGSATQTGQAAAITGVFIVYYNVLNKCGILKNVLLLFIPFVVVMLTQSRNSLVMLLISVFAAAIMYANRYRKLSIIKSIIISSIFIAVIYSLYSFFLDTDFGQRAVFVTEKNELDRFYQINSTGTIFDKIVGDRLIYYVNGWQLFLTKPLTGIGMWNYMYVTHGVYPLHSEYMVHLCEGGIIAFTIWILFVACIIRIIIKYCKDSKLKIAALSSIFVLLFCAIYAREFFSEWFYPVYGLIIAFMFKEKYCRFAK